MSGTTTRRAYPYPTDGDLLAQTDEAIQALAEAIDPLGLIGSASRTADQTGIVGSADLAGLSVTFTAIAGRRYKITGYAHIQTDAGDVASALQIADGGTVLGTANERINSLVSTTMIAVALTTFPAGAHTVRLVAAFSGGTNASRASAGSPAYLIVEDVG